MVDIGTARRVRKMRGYRALLKEVGRQFAGSDLESGYTFVYVWLTNQFGHFMIGFAGTILFSWIVSLFVPDALTTHDFFRRLVAAALIGGVWLLGWFAKEIFVDLVDALRALRFAKRQRAAALAGEPLPVATKVPRYKIGREDLDDIKDSVVAWRTIRRRQLGDGNPNEEAWFKADIVRDCRIDGWFYSAGVLTAIAMFAAPTLAPGMGWPWLVPLATFVAMLAISLPISRDWLWEKVDFDKAAFPFVQRFALSGRPYDDEERRRAIDFATLRTGVPRHLVVIGPPKSGRTTIAVALGVEAVLRSEQGVVVYTTWSKLLDRVAEQAQLGEYAGAVDGPQGDRPIRPPEGAEFLIIDDVGAEGAERRPFVTSDAFRAELQRNAVLRDQLAGSRIVWVVGDDPEMAHKWRAALQGAFGRVEIGTVVPGGILGRAERRIMPRAA
jgi:hypothetical protein